MGSLIKRSPDGSIYIARGCAHELQFHRYVQCCQNFAPILLCGISKLLQSTGFTALVQITIMSWYGLVCIFPSIDLLFGPLTLTYLVSFGPW